MFTDPVLQKLIAKYPAPKFINRSSELFESLLEHIISQQLSVKAADTIFKRFTDLFKQGVTRDGGHHIRGPLVGEYGAGKRQDPGFPTPNQILAMSDEKIRTAGISFQKISYIKSVADAFVSDLIDTKKIQDMTDEEVIATLTQIRGVGKWTAEMVLIFTLGRKDVFSLGDQGLKNAIRNLYGITDEKKILSLSETWKPNRSTACWYLWQSLNNL